MTEARPIRPPVFTSDNEYLSRLADVEYWRPFVGAVLERNSLAGAGREPVAGVGGSCPAFLCGDVVVKLFGHTRAWREGYRAERAAHVLIAGDAGISAPTLIADGRLFIGSESSWPYLITRRIHGLDWTVSTLSDSQKADIAVDLGRQIRRVHALHPWGGVATQADWPVRNVAEAAARSSLPPHLARQAEEFVARIGLLDNPNMYKSDRSAGSVRDKPEGLVFVPGDLFPRHILVEHGRLTGIIDWGDAMVTDRHYELAKLFLDTFHCDKKLLRTFLDASNWPVGKDFARRALALALCRQAIGLSQHLTNDTFFKLSQLFPLKDIRTLDDLATEVFGI